MKDDMIRDAQVYGGDSGQVCRKTVKNWNNLTFKQIYDITKIEKKTKKTKKHQNTHASYVYKPQGREFLCNSSSGKIKPPYEYQLRFFIHVPYIFLLLQVVGKTTCLFSSTLVTLLIVTAVAEYIY